MSLFPAYASEVSNDDDDDSSRCGEEWAVSPAAERQLLASDEEPPPSKRSRAEQAPAPAPAPAPDHFYLDTKRDHANLRVSTLYYPGRPEYYADATLLGSRQERGAGRRRRRYWQHAGAPAPRDLAPELAALAALRAALAASPADEQLWLRYIDSQREPAAQLEAAQEACARCDSAHLRAALHRAREAALTRDQLCEALRADLVKETRTRVRLELWTYLLEALGAEGATAGAAAALAHFSGQPAAYPRILHVHGCVLRAAGLWERLVLLIELVAAMNFPPSRVFPPARDEVADSRREEELQQREDATYGGGLPLHVVWARVERLRAAAHWRGAASADADPQRTPAAADLAELLRPAAERAELCVTLLRLARVPLPGSQRSARAAGPAPRAAEPALPESLLVLLRAARRLPPAHPASAPSAHAARAALAPLLDPPHYFSDADGFLRWTAALWELCCECSEGRRRRALLCWRLRWLHAMLRLAEPPEARRLRAEARALVRRLAPAAPEACAQLARLEADAVGAEPARRAALQTVRAAVDDEDVTSETALFTARVLLELSPGSAATVRWALCCAVLRRALPPDHLMQQPPPEELAAAALDKCEQRCAELEQASLAEEQVWETFLPGAGEWAAARVALTARARRPELLARLLQHWKARGDAAARYSEQAACALILSMRGAARHDAARHLLPLAPCNALMQLVCGSAPAPLWTGAAHAPSALSLPSLPSLALAALLPRLLRAPLAADTHPTEARGLASACSRWARLGADSPLLATLRLEASARSDSHPCSRALLAALHTHADHKWVYVRGAAWCGGEAAALCDALLERGLRLHTLLDELPQAELPAHTAHAAHTAAAEQSDAPDPEAHN